MRNNPIFQVLVTSGNKALLPAGSTLDSLTVGQLGIFNLDTNLSIVPTDPNPRIYFALGVDKLGTGSVNHIKFSAGQMIQAFGFQDITGQCYTAGQGKIIELSGMKAKLGTEYGLKFQFMNGDLLEINGYKLPMASYFVKTGCDEIASCDCTTESDCRILAKLFYDEILKDENPLLTVEIITEAGVVVPRKDYDAWVANPANDDKCLNLRFKANNENLQKACCGFNPKYNYLRQTDFDMSLIEGFSCMAGVETKIVQNVVYEQGSWYDIQQTEYFAGGWDGNPGVYREIGGLVQGADTLAVKGTNYTQITLLYDLRSIEGFKEYKNNTETRIAIPCGDKATLTSFSTIMDNWIEANFVNTKPIAAEIATCGC